MTQTPVRAPASNRTDGAARRHVGVLIIGSGFAGLGAAIRLAQDGRDDYLVDRAGQRGRRHLARQHLPGRGLRRPLAPVLVLLRAQPELVALVLPADRDPGLPARRRGEVRRRATSTCSTPRSPSRSGTPTAPLARRHDQRQLQRRRARRRGRRPVRAQAAPRSRASRRSAARSSTRRAGTTTPTSRASASRSSAPAPRPSRSARRSPATSPTSTSTSAPRRGSCRATTARTPSSKAWPTSACRSCSALAREAIYWGRESFMLGFAYEPRILQLAQRVAQRNIAKAINDPQLRAAVTPDWQIGCKRILISNTWYPMLARDDVDLVTDGIAEIRENAIVTHRRHRARGRRDHRRHRLPRHRLADLRAHRRRRRPVAGRRCGTSEGSRPTRARPSPASRTCCSWSARTPASGTARWST